MFGFLQELWGFQALLGPLLASEAQRVSALDILDKRNDDAEDAKHIDPEMIEVPYEVSAEMEAAWAAGGGRGHAAAAAGELEEGFDAGLAAALGANDDGTFGAEVLDLPGVAGVIHHEAAMAPSRREAAQRATAVGNRSGRKLVRMAACLGAVWSAWRRGRARRWWRWRRRCWR